MRARRRNGDENLRDLERKARLGERPDKHRWLSAVRRVEGLDGVQKRARSNDPDLLEIYAEMLEEGLPRLGLPSGVPRANPLLLGVKQALQDEAQADYTNWLGQILVVKRLYVLREDSIPRGVRRHIGSTTASELIELDPPAHVRVAPSDIADVRRRWIPGDYHEDGGQTLHYLDPLWRVEPLDHGTPWERPELDGVTEAWVHGPTIWLSGRVDWYPNDWIPAAAQGDHPEALAIRDYMEHRGRILLADQLHGYTDADDSNEWIFENPIRVRVEPTDIQSITHANDEWADPYWDVQIVGHPPRYTVKSSETNVVWRETEKEDDTLRSIWIDGISRSESGQVQRPQWVLEEQPESVVSLE